MPDLEGVIKGIKACVNDLGECEDCPYDAGRGKLDCGKRLYADAIALLKAQEPVKPIISEYTRLDDHKELRILCGYCYRRIDEDDSYCWQCGKKVKWE